MVAGMIESDDEAEKANKLQWHHLEEEGFYAEYELKDLLGRGLASTVRLCQERSTGENFAVKIVDISSERQSEEDAKRLQMETVSEVQILRLLAGHPSIIRMHNFYETPTFLFAVFELAGGELFDELNKWVTVSEKKGRKIMRQLIDGVSYMHDKGIVHRDLKLENILCVNDDRVVISDFGFAVQLKEGEKLKDLCGTPGYLAPETLKCQWFEDAKGYGMEVDNWALGVIMYTLLAGFAPFYHRKQLMMMRMIQQGNYDFHQEQWKMVTAEAKNMISGFLTVDVSKRLRAEEALKHPWMCTGTEETVAELKKDYRAFFRRVIICVRFLVRLSNYKYVKACIDRESLRKRPFRSREVRHEAEAAMFSIYGHWVNRGFHYSRDLLFANKPRPKQRKVEA